MDMREISIEQAKQQFTGVVVAGEFVVFHQPSDSGVKSPAAPDSYPTLGVAKDAGMAMFAELRVDGQPVRPRDGYLSFAKVAA